MKQWTVFFLLGWITCYYSGGVLAQSETDASELDKATTLDVVTWNLEWFGAPGKSSHASSFSEQLSAVSSKILELNADIYSLQEVVVDDLNGDFFTPLLESLNADYDTPRYIGFLAEKYSGYWYAPSSSYPAQRICFIVDAESVCVYDDFSMFEDVYSGSSTSSIVGYSGNASTFWGSGRLPYMMKAIVTADGISEQVDFINIHAKCCSDSESRRQYDAEYLYNALMSDYSGDNIVILGDYNDDMVTNPYESWYSDDNFIHTAANGIDHISVSNELEDEYSALSNSVQIDDVSISDHDPVMLRMLLNSSRKAQNIVMNNITDKKPGDIVTLTAQNSSGLDVEYQLLTGDAEIDGNELTCTGEGTVCVRAYNTGSSVYESAFSEVVRFNVSYTTGLSKVNRKKITVNPNPANSMVTISVDGAEACMVNIYNISGSLVKSFNSNGSDQLLINELPSGIYLVSVVVNNQKYTERLMIKH